MSETSSSHENYLEAIAMLGGNTKTSVRSVDLANKLDVSKASVNKAISVLKEEGLVDQPYYGDITLTDKGYRYACSVLGRHKMLYLFLTRAVGIPEDVAEDEACRMEHAISDDSYKKWLQFINTLDLCPVSC